VRCHFFCFQPRVAPRPWPSVIPARATWILYPVPRTAAASNLRVQPFHTQEQKRYFRSLQPLLTFFNALLFHSDFFFPIPFRTHVVRGSPSCPDLRHARPSAGGRRRRRDGRPGRHGTRYRVILPSPILHYPRQEASFGESHVVCLSPQTPPSV